MMPPPHPRVHLLLAAVLGLGQVACAADAPAPSGPAAATSMSGVTALIGEAECDEPNQCRVVGVGSKPCGGPRGYLAWSVKRTDAAALAAAVESQKQAEAEDDRKRGLLSNCMVTPAPAAVCRPRASDGRKTCQLGQGGTRSVD